MRLTQAVNQSAASTLLPKGAVRVALYLALTALCLRILIIHQTGFEGLYGQDPFAYLDYANAFRAAVAQGQWPPPFFWPIGYPALVAAFSVFGPAALVAQLISVVSSTLIVVLTFQITRDVLGDQPHALAASTFAALIVALAGQMLISSISSMSDEVSLFWATLSAFGLMRYHNRKTLRWLALAGYALGWAVMTRWVYALLIPVWGAAILVDFFRRENRSWLPALCFFALGVFPQVALMAHEASLGKVSHLGDLETYNWSLSNAIAKDIVNPDGHFVYTWPIAVYYALPVIHPSYIFPLFALLTMWGVLSLRSKPFLLIFTVGWIGINWIFLAGVSWQNWRFPLAFFPPLAVLAGAGLGAALGKWPSKSRLVAVLASAGLAISLGWGIHDVNVFVERQRTDRAMADWVLARVPPNATVITFGITDTLEYFTHLNVVEIFEQTPSTVKEIVQDRTNVFLCLDKNNIETQWVGLAPQTNFHLLRDQFNLRPVDSQSDYTLYAVSER